LCIRSDGADVEIITAIYDTQSQTSSLRSSKSNFAKAIVSFEQSPCLVTDIFAAKNGIVIAATNDGQLLVVAFSNVYKTVKLADTRLEKRQCFFTANSPTVWWWSMS